MRVSLAQALAWRLERHHLTAGAASATAVVERLCAVPAWSGDPDLAVRRRLADPQPESLVHALENGDLLRTYAFRGATHLLTAADAGAYMAVRCANRQWELPSWQEFYGLRAEDWPALRAVVREAVADGPLTQAELADAVAATARFRHLHAGLSHRSHTLLKPFGWQGDLCFGPSRDGRATFRSPTVSPGWTGLPALDDAGRQVVTAYLACYGPATRENLGHWLVQGLSAGARRLDRWLAALVGKAVVEIDVGGRSMLLLREHGDGLAATSPGAATTLLPGHDQWVLGPGTADTAVVPARHRAAIGRGANAVLSAGTVAGTWRIVSGAVVLSWADDDGAVSPEVVAEVGRLSAVLGRDLDVTVEHP